MNITTTTLKHDFCIGCGICAASCPSSSIEMKYNEDKVFYPVINNKTCTQCGLCSTYCPNTYKKLRKEALSCPKESYLKGLSGAKYFVGCDKNTESRQKSASGGIASLIAKDLLQSGAVNGVIHAQTVEAKHGQPHYKAVLSTTVDEVDTRKSSIYGPVCFNEVLSSLEQGRTYLFMGTPCVIQGVTELFAGHNKFKDIKIFTLALVCSHSVSGAFSDYLAESLSIKSDTPYCVNLRNKDNIVDANNYNNHFYNSDGDIAKINRFKSAFTKLWRNYCFANNVCSYCSDFWGYKADISIKDAWGQWAKDPLGKSIMVVRNDFLYEKLTRNQDAQLSELHFYDLIHHQKTSVDYKQFEGNNKFTKSLFHPKNIKNKLLKYKLFAVTSKFLYCNFGFKLTKPALNVLLNISAALEKLNESIYNIYLILRCHHE